ncbi:MAG: 16S rRNA (guanine(527)-N(7))-methyltransferase RsmG [Ignavibacteria bacterium]|nr:16S rRNA (guanine(527)-N(7))-methyltransferase RsmG [Ignavibacteria bacterium]
MKLLRKFLKDELGIDPENKIAEFQKYESALLEWNNKINLVSRKTESIEEHILNSIFFLKKINIRNVFSLADIGTGGGFPGIPIKILYPNIRVTLVDSIRKKITALEDIIRQLGIDGIEAVCSRAEDLGKHKEFRRSFEAVTAKAVAPLDKLYEWSKDLLANNGRMIFIKGGDTEGELLELKKHSGKITIEEVKFQFDPVYPIEDKKIITINNSSRS